MGVFGRWVDLRSADCQSAIQQAANLRYGCGRGATVAGKIFFVSCVFFLQCFELPRGKAGLNCSF